MSDRVHLNAGLYELPQYVSEDRQRTRRAHCRKARAAFEWQRVEVQLSADEVLRLPGRCKQLPASQRHTPAATAHLAIDRVKMRQEARLTKLRRLGRDPRRERHFEHLFGPFSHPANHAIDNWRSDLEFARLQLNGVNPMRIRRIASSDDSALMTDEVERAIIAATQSTLDALIREDRLFVTEYTALANPHMQAVAKRRRDEARRQGRRPAWLAAPTCIAWNDGKQLVPLTIQLQPPGSELPNPVFTPACARNLWLVARSHVHTAAGLTHEGIYHLLETHLINEAIAVSLYRQVHEDHPLRQLLDPHYVGTLAQNAISRQNLLSPGGPFDTAIVTGVEGGFIAMAQYYQHWHWREATLSRDLAARGFADPALLEYYYYASDGRAVHAALARFVDRYLRIWYRSDVDVCMDYELHAFLAEVQDPEQGNVRGFTVAINSVETLVTLVTDMIFRAGPQHSAVNNGQYDEYGFVPNHPGTFHRRLPTSTDELVSERELWQAMPTLREAIQQKSLAWILSRPTDRTLLHVGESPVFDASVCAELRESLRGFRRRLHNISDQIEARNQGLAFPYLYLDPSRIARSTDT